MSLPKIKINILNGQTGAVGEMADGLCLLVCGAVAVDQTFALDTPYEIRRPEALKELGVTASNNFGLTKLVTEFYQEAGDGTKVVVMGVDDTLTLSNLCDKTNGPIRPALKRLKGEVRFVAVCLDPQEEEIITPTEGLDPDLFDALPKAQETAELMTSEQYAPVVFLLEGRHYNGTTNLKDITTTSCNRVAVMVGDTLNGSVRAAVGLLAGRLAKIPVQRNAGRVRDGAMKAGELYLGTKKLENVGDDVEKLYDKGYITPRVHVGRAGYYFSDDRTATEQTDDYSHLTARRTVDKACRIAYNMLLDYLLDNLYVNSDGTLQPGVAKSMQASVERAVDTLMTANGELSADGGASAGGCMCYIDQSQNVVATSVVSVTIGVRPFGYARTIEANIGLYVESN